eukprot:TRINITY_DN11241_c0_g4_i1.p3 TRINITY_DN11241_c0_g4~~TRINITY_DN11241_c0_g4_i1.p3  ORF type:complete len:246 (+),score=108.55 TRINITY_DN11241_c0_g4_i1:69-806(+)
MMPSFHNRGLPFEFLPQADSSQESSDCPMSEEPRTPLNQCITPESLTPDQSQKTQNSVSDTVATEESWMSWTLQEEDVVDVMTSAAAREVDVERTVGFAKEQCLGVLVKGMFQNTNWCGRDPAVAKRALCAIFTLLIKTPEQTLPLAAVNKELKWKTRWWRDLGSLYSFVRRTGRDFFSYHNADLGMLLPLTTNDVAFLQWNDFDSPFKAQKEKAAEGAKASAMEVPQLLEADDATPPMPTLLPM